MNRQCIVVQVNFRNLFKILLNSETAPKIITPFPQNLREKLQRGCGQSHRTTRAGSRRLRPENKPSP